MNLINLKRKEIDIKMEVRGRRYIDTIFELTPIQMIPNDQLSVTFDLNICGSVNGIETSRIHEKFTHVINVKEKCKVKYVRLVKFGRKARIDIYSKMPKDIIIPKIWNAEEVV